MKNILFVCTGNSCRSPMAEALFRQLACEAGHAGDLRIASAGLSAPRGQGPTPQAVDVLAEENVDLSGHRTRPVTEDLINRADVVVAMTRGHLDTLMMFSPRPPTGPTSCGSSSRATMATTSTCPTPSGCPVPFTSAAATSSKPRSRACYVSWPPTSARTPLPAVNVPPPPAK